MCDHSHTYTVEVIGQPARYVGASDQEAVSALLTINDDDEEGYVVAEHFNDDIGHGVSTAYCSTESNRLEIEAIVASARIGHRLAVRITAEARAAGKIPQF
jgi:hypothetical protein